MSALKKACQKRDVLTNSITECYRFSVDAQKNPQFLENFKVRYSDLDENYEKFGEYHNAVIMALPESDTDDEYKAQDKIRKDTQTFYYECKMAYNKLCSQTDQASQGHFVRVESNAKLHKLSVPTFKGDSKFWPTFFDLYNQIVHENANIGNVQKLQYLFSFLEGEPLKLLTGITITDDNYKIAYHKLVSRYQNKRLMASNALHAIISVTLKNDSSKELRNLIDTFSESLAVLNALGFETTNWDFILFFILLEKIDIPTRTNFEVEFSQVEIPKYENLYRFLENKCKALESVQHSTFNKTINKPYFQQSSKPNNFANLRNNTKPSTPFSAFVSDNNISPNPNIKCFKCNSLHVLSRCPKFLEQNPQDRLSFIKQKKLCLNCLHPSHSVQNCSSVYRCKTCNNKHHTLVHISNIPKNIPEQNCANLPHCSTSDTNTSNQSSSNNLNTHCGNILAVQGTVLLATAIVDIMDGNGNYQPIRILIDNGSQNCFLSENCLRRLNLPRQQFTTSIFGLNQMSSFTSKGLAHCTIKPKGKINPLFSFEAIVVPKLCSDMPSFTLQKEEWEHLKGLQLADQSYYISSPIDLLLGAEIFTQILKERRIVGQVGQPTAIETIFGWVVLGKINNSIPSTSTSYFLNSEVQPLELIMPKFWELEEIPSKPFLSSGDQQAESIFTQTVSRTNSGRFVVSLPFKDSEPDLGNTYPQALRRFLLLESRLIKNTELYESYSAFLKEYIDQEYMSLITQKCRKPTLSCYLPHHCVLKPDSVSTKLRVVWDASAKGPKGLSLNDTLLPGPKLQNDLSSLLLIFRIHPIVFIADIRRMFLQILVTPAHRNFQRILWRFSPKDPICEYELNTVTFGVSSSPFLAIRTLNELAEREKDKFPDASRILKDQIYIDDILGTSPSISSALSLQKQLIDLLQSGGFQLAKWASNCPELLAAVPESDRQMSLSFDKDQPNLIKVLGLQWHPKDDIFTYQYILHNVECTKRTILQVIGRIFDPLGFLCPIILLAKYIMQQLWISKIGWDETPPQPIVETWGKLQSELPFLSNFKLSRQISLTSSKSCDIIAMCDASNKGYAAVVYFRVEEKDSISVSLIYAKSRVAPISNRQTLARLELLGAVLLSDLVEFIIKTLSSHITFENIYAYTDSQIVLAWLNSPPERWQTFVANRVNHVQKIIPPSSWHYIPSALNSADCASRGLTASKLINHDMWWNGPAFLWQPKEDWPISLKNPPLEDFSGVNIEENRKVFTTTTVEIHPLDNLIERFSSLPKIQRILSYCLRVKINFLKSNTKIYHHPTPDEMLTSYFVLIKHVQISSFSDLYSKLKDNIPISKPFRKLSPFIDKQGLLRVGGRLQNSDLPYSAKHPLLLPKIHPFTNLVIEHTHNQHLHPGLKTLHHLILQQFWILSARHIIQKVLSKCLQCFRAKPKPYQPPPMGNLPFHRINQLKPFSHIAIDFCGPFYVTPYRYRGAKVLKSYVCVFVCTIYKIIHLELTTDLSTEGFVAAFRRFISRRGTVTDCWSDQGSNFIGFHNQLLEYSKEASEKLSIRWHLGPPLSPHFNALAESGVKSFKSHFIRVVGDQKLTIEEMTTLICQIEAVLNSRPLTAQSTDPNDLLPLTPFHFLTLEPLNSGIPDPDLSHLKINRLSRWQLIQKLHADFWKKFSLEYLNTLQQRHKWSNPSNPIKLNTLVLIQSDLKSPLKWPLGRVIELHPGEDGHIRVATVKTSTGNFKRPVIKLCPLPDN